MIKLTTMLFSILLCFGSVVEGSDQQSATQGWIFGFDLGRDAVSFEIKPSDRGVLVGPRVGYGLNRIVTLYASASYADIEIQDFDAFDKVTVAHVDYGVRLHPVNSRRWVPYGDIALTFWPVSDVLKNGEQATTDFSGLPTFSLGGGLVIYLSEAWAFDVNFKLGKGYFKDVEVDNILDGGTSEHLHNFLDIHAKSARLSVGVSWWP